MKKSWVREIWRRAGAACEYCRMPQRFYPVPFQIDHIIARQHGGDTALRNLALACLHWT
jgi:5-methylcytosine-specific restriction endonuclease McrA